MYLKQLNTDLYKVKQLYCDEVILTSDISFSWNKNVYSLHSLEEKKKENDDKK